MTGEIFDNYFLLIVLHSTAHFLHASAQFLQQSWVECFSHSAAHALQRSAQSLHSASLNDEPRASNLAHKAQMSAQSRQRDMHLIWLLSHISMQHVAQSSHSTAHAIHASIHDWLLWWLIVYPPRVVRYIVIIISRHSESITLISYWRILTMAVKISYSSKGW